MKKKENQFISLIFNIILPVLIMTKLSGTEGAFSLGPKLSLILAVLFPLGYGIYDYSRSRKINFISLLGLISVLLTGIMGLFHSVTPIWFAIKEASVPLIIGIVIIISIKSGNNVVKKLLFNDEIMDMDRVYLILEEKNEMSSFHNIIKTASYWVAFSFLISSILNFALARIILVSEPGTSAYIEEIGKMNGLSFPVIALPCSIILVLVLFYVFKQIKTLTGLQLEDIIKK